MNFGGHLMTGWLIGRVKNLPYAERRFVTAMGVAPDADGFAIVIPALFEEWHRTFGHNVFFGLLVPLTAFVFFDRGRALRVLPWAYLSLSLHYVLDLLVTGWWAFYPFWPVNDWMILMSEYIPEDTMKYPIQIGLFCALAVATVLQYRRTRTSPLEAISISFDRFVTDFIATPFRHRCADCGGLAFYKIDQGGEEIPLCGKHARIARGFRVVRRE